MAIADESVVAIRITEENARRLLCDSPDRTGGIGDWYLANRHIWAIVDDVENQNMISPAGGSLIDLGLVSNKTDQFVQMLQLLNMNRDIVIPYDTIRTESGDDWAAILVSTSSGLHPQQHGFGVPDEAAAANIQVETTYRLNSDEHFLHVTTTIRNPSSKSISIFNVADIIYWGDDTVKPFAGSPVRMGSARGAPRGFRHPDLDTSSFISLMRGMGGYTYIAGGGVDGLPPISYGLCSPTEYAKNALLWGINDRMVSAIGIFTGDHNRTFDFWKTPFFRIRAGQDFTYDRIVVVGENNDAASATDIIFPLLGMADRESGITGRVSPPAAGCSILIIDKDEFPVTQIRPVREGPEAGRFKAVLPSGEYTAEIFFAERDARPESPDLDPLRIPFAVAGSVTDLGTIEAPPQAALLIEVKEGGQAVPARVIIRGIQGTPDPDLGSDLLHFTVGNRTTPSSFAANWLLLSGQETGPVRVGLRPGRYEVVATHGFEYSVDRQEVMVERPNDEALASLQLERVIETPGMMTGDFHVHSIASMDSAFPQEQRVLSFVAEGVELLIATDHDTLTDYAPVISTMGLSDRIASIVGVEATSMLMVRSTPFTIGHYNAWPLRFNALLPRNGMPLDEGIRPRVLYERLRDIGDGDIVIQVNHGRGSEPDGGASFFHALGTEFGRPLSYKPSQPMNEFPNNLLLEKKSSGIRDIDFDAMELLNGTAYDEYLLLRSDWFSLLNQGFSKAATANSDTHIKAQIGGYPRNYILLQNPDAERATERDIMKQISNQRLFGTTGPLVYFTVNEQALPGDIITPEENEVTLNVKVLAAPWIPLDQIRIYANGKQQAQYPVDSKSGINRFDQDIILRLESDAWVTVETSTANDPLRIPQPPGGLYNIIAPGFVPLAFSNPIFVDIDGNGIFDPPGIPPSSAAAGLPWPAKTSLVAALLALMSIIRHLRRRRRILE